MNSRFKRVLSWGNRIIAQTVGELVTVADVEIVEAGIEYPLASGPTTFTPEDLAEAVAAQDDPAIKAPRIKLGHEGPLATMTSDMPAVGVVKDMRLDNNGQTIVGDLTGVPKWLAEIMASAYPSRSIEGNFAVETTTGHNWRLVITHLSLLGVAHPGVNTLEDIQALYSPEGPDNITVIEAKEGEVRRRRPVTASVSAEDVRRAFYDTVAVDDRFWWWITAHYQEPPLLVAEDDDGNQYIVTYEIKGDEVSFGDPSPAKIQYVNEETGKVAAGQEPAAIFASAAETRPDDHNQPEETNAMTPEELRKRLGLAEDASDEEVNSRFDELTGESPPSGDPPPEPAPAPEPEPEPAPAEPAPEEQPEEQPAGATASMDPAALDQLRRDAEAGRTARAQQVTEARERLLNDAIKAGKFPPSRKEHYQTAHIADPEGTEQLIASLSPGLIPLDERGGAGTVESQTQAEYDPNWLSPVERARIEAARSGSEATVTIERPQGRE